MFRYFHSNIYKVVWGEGLGWSGKYAKCRAERAFVVLAPVAEALLELSERKMDPREMVEVPGMMLKLHSRNPHVASLLQQAVTMPSGQLENRLLEEWLSKLLHSGKQALMKADYNSVDEIDISLRILNLFNLCIGYFTNGSLLERLCGMKPDDPEVLKRQERILHVTSKAWALSA